MKHIQTFEAYVSSVNEAASDSLNVLKKALPGMKFQKADYELDPEGEYQTVESFYVNVPGISGGYGEDDLYINIYDGKDFCFFHDSAPIGTSLHSSSEINSMAQMQVEVPKPLSKLNKKIFDEAVKNVKETMGVEESRANEGTQSMGNLAKKMTTPGVTGVGEWDTFVDAVKKEKDNGEDLPKEWYDALKTLKIKPEEAAVIFFDAVGSQDDVEYKANRLNLKYVIVEGSDDGGSGGIIFSMKQ